MRNRLKRRKGIHVFDAVRIDDHLEIEDMTAPSRNYPKYVGWLTIETLLKKKDQ